MTHLSEVPAWAARLVAELDRADAHAIGLLEGLEDDQLNWRPRPDAWSIGQCLEHLSLSNEVYIAPIAESLRSARTEGGRTEEIVPGWFARWFIRTYIDPATQAKRGRAPSKAAPVARRIDATILSRFIASNAAIRGVIHAAADLDVNHVRFRNPFVPGIRFTVGTGFEILARHNHRHLLQADRVKHAPGFPASH